VSWPIYTERVCSASDVSGPGNYTVPAGKRLIVKTFTAISIGPGTGAVDFLLHGRRTAFTPLPAAGTTICLQMHAVGYQRQAVSLGTGGVGIYAHVDGFLFDDPSGATGPPNSLGDEPGDDQLLEGTAWA
jgi:hypothetical protein